MGYVIHKYHKTISNKNLKRHVNLPNKEQNKQRVYDDNVFNVSFWKLCTFNAHYFCQAL